jgi:hypothetical protein
MVRLGGEIILLNCCKWLQMRQDFLSGYGCLYRTFVTWKLVLGLAPTSGRATDVLEAIIRRLWASPARPPPPLRCALARTPNNPCYREARWDRSNRISSASRLRAWPGCDDPASRGGALREPSYG